MSLKKDLFSGVFYTAVARYSGLIVSLVIAGVLARLIPPEDFGVVAVATVIISFFGIFTKNEEHHIPQCRHIGIDRYQHQLCTDNELAFLSENRSRKHLLVVITLGEADAHGVTLTADIPVNELLHTVGALPREAYDASDISRRKPFRDLPVITA